MRFPFYALALATVVALPAAAQEHGAGHSPAGDMAPLQDSYLGWVITAAEEMSEADYAFKPTPEVRSLGALFGHVANANYMICATILGEKSPATANYETEARSSVIAGLKASATYCNRAYSMPHDAAMKQVELFGMKGSGVWALAFNASHNAEHYGNVVTYMRLRGKVPPSSR
jgi:uncharacterized damage-inducible protein DinB